MISKGKVYPKQIKIVMVKYFFKTPDIQKIPELVCQSAELTFLAVVVAKKGVLLNRMH